MTDNDVIIVGGGIAGLYAAMQIVTRDATAKILILESCPRLGGRSGNDTFRGMTVVTGAGVGRFEKDVLLRALLKQVDVSFVLMQKVKHNYASTVDKVDLMGIIKKLRKIPTRVRSIFKTFAKKHLGTKQYEAFVETTGYTDFEKEDAHDVLYNYGMEDNTDGWTPMRIIWVDLIKSMKEWLLKHKHVRIKTNAHVNHLRIHEKPAEMTVCTTAQDYKARTVIVATTIDSVRSLLPDKKIYKKIQGQPFMRLYAEVAKCSREAMRIAVAGLTIVPQPLQEIIPFDHDKGIYMIGYADNESAIILEKYKDEKEALTELVQEALGLPKDSVKILNVQSHFWKIGTHYYDTLPAKYDDRNEFLHEAQRPYPNIFVVGEVVAINQGWVEGALQSVRAIMNGNTIS